MAENNVHGKSSHTATREPRHRSKRADSTGVLDRVRDRVSSEVNARKDKATDRLEEVAHTVRRIGEPLKDQPYDAVGRYVDRAATQLEQMAEHLRDRQVEQLLADLARKRPGVFVGVGLAAGLLAARFLKSGNT